MRLKGVNPVHGCSPPAVNPIPHPPAPDEDDPRKTPQKMPRATFALATRLSPPRENDRKDMGSSGLGRVGHAAKEEDHSAAVVADEE